MATGPFEEIGGVSIAVVGDLSELETDFRKGIELSKSAGEKMAAAFESGAIKFGEITKSISAGVEALAHGTVKVAEAAAAVSLAYVAASKALATYIATTSTAASAGESLANTFRAVRLVLSPTVFTAGGIAVGVLAEETIKAAINMEKLIEKQAELAASSKQSFQSINALAEAEKQLGVTAGSFKLLGIENIDTALPKLADIKAFADQMKGIEDPVKRADMAFQKFGENAAAIMPLINRDLKSAIENAYDLSRQLDAPTRESLYRIRTAFDDFINFFKSGWRSISLESSDLWHNIEIRAIKALTAVEQGVHGLAQQMGADFRAAGVQLEGILTNAAKLLPSGGAGGFEPGMGLAGPAEGGVSANIPSALELANTARTLGTELLAAMNKPKLPAEALNTTFRHLAMTAEEIAAAAKKAAAELAAAFSKVGSVDFARELKDLNEAWNLLAATGHANADVLAAYNRQLDELSTRVPGVTQAYKDLTKQEQEQAGLLSEFASALSPTAAGVAQMARELEAARAALKSWQEGTLATLPDNLTDVTRSTDALTYSMERLGQVFGNLDQITVDPFKAIKNSILETSDLLEGIGLKSTSALRVEADRLGDTYQRLIDLQREGKATTLDVAGAYDKWTEAEMKVAGISRTLTDEQARALKDVRQAINSISESLANSIIHWKGFEQVGITALEAIGKAILKNIIQHFLDATGLVDKLLAGVGTVLSKIGLGGLSGATGAAASTAAAGTATTAAGAAASGAGGAASAASGALGLSSGAIGLIGAGVAVAAGITQGIQMSRLINLTGEIEISTRQCKEILGHFQPIFETWLPKLGHLVDIWGAINAVNDQLRFGLVNVNIAGADKLGESSEPGSATPTPMQMDTTKAVADQQATNDQLNVANQTYRAGTAISEVIDNTSTALVDLGSSISAVSTAISDSAGAFQSQYRAIQESTFGGTADITGEGGFVNPAFGLTGTSGRAVPSDDQNTAAMQAFSQQLQQLAQDRAQQTADALAGMQHLAVLQFSKAFQAATAGHNIRMDSSGSLYQLDQAGNLIDADTGKVLVNYEQLYNQYANPTGQPTGQQGMPDITRTNALGGITRLVANQKAMAAAPIDYATLMQNYSAKLNTSYTTGTVEGMPGLPMGGNGYGGDSRTIIIQAFDPASRAIGRGLVEELQNNGIYK